MNGEQGEFVSRDEVVQGLFSLGAEPSTLKPLRRAVCKLCGLPVQWARTRDDNNIPMQPGRFPAWRIPVEQRWSFTRDRIHHAPWLEAGEQCRLVHMDICPGREKPGDPVMAELWGRLWERAERQNGGIPVRQEEPEA